MKVQLAEPLPLGCAHAAAWRGLQVVVALQVENAVDDVECEFPAGRGAELSGLRNGARDRNNQLSVTRAVVKTQDIGRAGGRVILLVETGHGGVTHQHNAERL